MANYPQELAQDAVCQSHTGHMTGLWFLPARPLRLNINEWKTQNGLVTSSSIWEILRLQSQHYQKLYRWWVHTESLFYLTTIFVASRCYSVAGVGSRLTGLIWTRQHANVNRQLSQKINDPKFLIKNKVMYELSCKALYNVHRRL